jgi:MFS family permease
MTRSNDQSTSAPTAWSPLRFPVFRDLLLADLVSDIGAFMQTVGAAWLMTSLTTRVTYVALIQTASALPFFFLALPAGAIGDIFNRRKLILGTEIWMAAVAILLAVATIAHVMTPWILLLLTLALSLGDAVESPAWRAIFPDLVPKKDLSPALALNGIEFNLARAVGPGLAGLIIAAAGVGAAFILNAVSFLGVIFVIARWKHPSHARKTPAETIPGGTLAAVRYVRYSPSIQILLVRAGCVIFCTSAFWALLPSVAKTLNKGAIGYGLLLACFGTGAVLGAIALDRARATLSTETLLTIATFLFGAVVLATGTVGILSVLCLLMTFAGAAWIVFMSLFNTLIQNLAPDWVRARVLAVYLFVFQGSVALGSLVWGYVADRTSVELAFLLSSVGIGLSTLLRFPLPLPTASVDLSSWNHWGKPALFAEPKPTQGPVLVTVEYTIDPKRASEFLAVIYKYQRIRRRDGAIQWGIFYDAGTSNRYLESFLLDSWAEHERQHDRFTLADRDLENQVKQFSLEPAKVKHYIHASRRPPANQTSHETRNRR